MFLKELFSKPSFIAFYKDEEKYLLLCERYKKNTLINSETKTFEDKKSLSKYINEIIEDNPQTYVSTVLLSQNQGVVPSCDKKTYKEMKIDIESVKMTCIKNSYSFYTTIYELNFIKKEHPYIDFLYSAFAVIDFKSTLKHNTLYVLTTKEYSFFLIYQNKTAIFGDILEMNDDFQDIDNTEIEDISDLDLVDDFEDSLNENVNSIEEFDNEDINIENTNYEKKIFELIQTVLKEYYDNGGDFIEKIFIFDTIGVEKTVTNIIKDELFIDTGITHTDILKTINEISRENV